MTRVIDLRSDTVTRPTDGMRRAMAEADVGDDVFGDDPTVNLLEARTAELLGKEAALFVPSGTMANLLAVISQAEPGDEVLLGDESHIFNSEAGGSARIGGVQMRPLPVRADGSIAPADVARAIRPPDIHAPRSALFCMETTHNRCGGAAVPQAALDEAAEAARAAGLATHLDGARIFNAQVATGVPAARIAARFDTVSTCLSKGLGAPVGSLLCGPEAVVATARRNRKMLGGGMRQAGILAAAGLYAFEHNIARLGDDHALAVRLADGLRRLGAFSVVPPQTNIVLVDVAGGSAASWLEALRREGVLAVAFGPQRVRLVTHLDVTEADIDEAVARVSRAVGAVAA